MEQHDLATKQDNTIEQVIIKGDLTPLTTEQRVDYYMRVCQSLGLNPYTQPFAYIQLSGKLTLYARKDAADQLRSLHGVSIDDVNVVENETQYIVKVKGHNKDGRSDVEIGVVNKTDMQGNLANAQMKAVTKGKRRLTLSLCGLGMLDETEIESIPDAKVSTITVELPTETSTNNHPPLEGHEMTPEEAKVMISDSTGLPYGEMSTPDLVLHLNEMLKNKSVKPEHIEKIKAIQIIFAVREKETKRAKSA